jgi:hypothetical protein
MQIDPSIDLIVVAVHARDALFAIDPSNPEGELVALRSEGAKPTLQPHASMEYAPNVGGIVYFSPVHHGAVHFLAPPDMHRSGPAPNSWRWRACVPTAGTLDPVADAARRSRYDVQPSHVFGRFRVASFGTIDLGILLRHIDTPVYVMRLS